MKRRRQTGIVDPDEIVHCGSQIWIHRLQQPKDGCNLCIVISNGYTVLCTPVMGRYKFGKHDEPDIAMFNSKAEILACYYQPTCTGLQQGTQELRNFLEGYAVGKDLWLIGHSKSAQPQIDIKHEMKPCYRDINVVTVSPAFGGTGLANKKTFLDMPKRLPFLMRIFWNIGFQNIPVETDLAINSEYIQKRLHDSRPVTMNFVSRVSSCKKAQDIGGLLNIFLNWALKYKEQHGGDGIVSVWSQTLGVESSLNRYLDCPHCHALADACYELVKIYNHLAKT